MKNKCLKICRSVTALLLIAFVTGCVSGPSSYFRSRSRPGGAKVKVAIIPFNNFSSQKDADMKVSYSLITHLLRSDYFDVLETGETQKAMKQAKVRKDEDLSIENIIKIGELSGADVLLLGTIEEYKIDSSTVLGEKIFVPEVSINIRLVSTGDGSIIWAANHHRRGDDRVTIFGMGRIDSISELTDVIIADTIQSLVKVMKKRRDAVALMKNGHSKTAAPEDDSSAMEEKAGLAQEIEALREDKAALESELLDLKKKLSGKEPAAQPADAAAPKEASSPPAAERQVIKNQFKKEFEKIKGQY